LRTNLGEVRIQDPAGDSGKPVQPDPGVVQLPDESAVQPDDDVAPRTGQPADPCERAAAIVGVVEHPLLTTKSKKQSLTAGRNRFIGAKPARLNPSSNRNRSANLSEFKQASTPRTLR